jgi:hypothetical protein
LCLLYNVWGCITVLKDHTSWQMFMPLPANSLMQLVQHVTPYVHIHFWSQSMNIILMTPAAKNIDATAFQLILSKMVNPCLTSPQIQGTHVLLL